MMSQHYHRGNYDQENQENSYLLDFPQNKYSKSSFSAIELQFSVVAMFLIQRTATHNTLKSCNQFKYFIFTFNYASEGDKSEESN